MTIPFNLLVFLPESFEPFCWSCLNFDQAKTDSTIPDLTIPCLNLSVMTHLDPNALAWDVILSFVCESKVGLVIRQFTKTHKWFLIWWGFTCIPDLFFFLIESTKISVSNLVTWSTCLPPKMIYLRFQCVHRAGFIREYTYFPQSKTLFLNSTFCRSNGVHKRHLLKSIRWWCNSNLPPLTAAFINALDLLSSFVCLIFDK